MRVRTWSDWGGELARSGQSLAGCVGAINQFFSKHIWILSSVAWAALVGGLFPFTIADIFANDEGREYVPALLIMMLFAGIWGHLTFLWITAFTPCRWFTKFLQLILVLAFLRAASFVLYDVHRLPVYAAFLAPSLFMFLRRGHLVLSGLGCVMLAVVAILTLQPDLRIAFFSRKYSHSCLCCGSKPRAVDELLSLGSGGREALLQCISKQKASGWTDELRCVREGILGQLPAQGPADLMAFRERVKQVTAY